MNGGSPDPAPSPPAHGPIIRTIAMPGDANPSEDIFGGWLMTYMTSLPATSQLVTPGAGWRPWRSRR